jgi:hypothetical protein
MHGIQSLLRAVFPIHHCPRLQCRIAARGGRLWWKGVFLVGALLVGAKYEEAALCLLAFLSGLLPNTTCDFTRQLTA